VIARQKTLTSALAVLIASTLSVLQALAQTTTDVTTNETTQSAVTTTTWYANPWIWAAGVGVFLIIVIALTSRGGRST
jgi:hypothetical protein